MKLFITGGSGFIGTHTVACFADWGYEILNYDLEEPLNPAQLRSWVKGDILDPSGLHKALSSFSPEAVIHLAGRAECDESTTVEEGYSANTLGTQNLLLAVKECPTVRQLIVTSSQFVCGPEYAPQHDEDFNPVTVYGQSKVITEQLTRAAKLNCTWTITRPTNIWGAWHRRYQREFWRVVEAGFYVHPGGRPVVRCYGYVKNIVAQMRSILEAPSGEVDRQVFYLGDEPDDIFKWTDEFSRALRGTRARKIPRPLLVGAGLLGDLIGVVTGTPFYINSSRVRSMTSDYVVNMEKTFRLLKAPQISLTQGVQETVAWLRSDKANPSGAREAQ